MSDPLVILEAANRQHGLHVGPATRGLVVLVHADSASQQHSGYRFIVDVLRANGLATLSVSLHPAQEQRDGVAAPGQVLIKHRLRALFGWLETQESCRRLPLALVGIDEAVRGCVAAAARYRPAPLRSLILVDGRPDHVAKLLARLTQPTLMLMGASDARSLSRQRAAVRLMNAPSSLEVLAMATRPVAASGAHQALAHAVMNWLDKTLWSDPPYRPVSRSSAARPQLLGTAGTPG